MFLTLCEEGRTPRTLLALRSDASLLLGSFRGALYPQSSNHFLWAPPQYFFQKFTPVLCSTILYPDQFMNEQLDLGLQLYWMQAGWHLSEHWYTDMLATRARLLFYCN